MEISIEFELPARIRKKGAWFISSCPLLDVFSQGQTREEAERNLVDALASFLTSCYERGTLDAVLRESGVVPASGLKTRKPVTRRGDMAVRVPLPFAVRAKKRRAVAS
jgi:predicted RNase H-like HicB family nuclease